MSTHEKALRNQKFQKTIQLLKMQMIKIDKNLQSLKLMSQKSHADLIRVSLDFTVVRFQSRGNMT